MKNLMYVFLGGGLGSVLRYGFNIFLNKPSFVLPFGTLIANIIGCFLIGIFAGIFSKNNPMYFLLAIGFCGGFTTLSSLSNEMFLMIKANQIFQPIIYLFLTTLLGLVSTFLGYLIIK